MGSDRNYNILLRIFYFPNHKYQYISEKEGNVLFNDAHNSLYLRLYGIGHKVKNHSDSERGNLLPPHGYSFRLAGRVLLYAPSHRQDSTYHSLCYTSRGALAGTRNNKQLYGVRHMVNNHSVSERGNPLLPHVLLFQISSKGSFICIIPQTG